MGKLFSIDNPIWKFIGKLADHFCLSILWYVTSIPIFTIGASTSALYYVSLKTAADQEGMLFKSYFHSFKENFRQGTILWLIYLAAGIILAIDLYWSIHTGSNAASAMLITVGIVGIIYLCVLSFQFVLLARISNTIPSLFKITCSITIQNFLPILSGVIVSAGFAAVGVFVFWPVLLFMPGLSAYLNSFLYNRILAKYHFDLPDYNDSEK